MRAIDTANFYIQLVNSLPEGHITNLKLNKLLYFAQGHCLARLNRPLFEDQIQAWEHGPVIPEVYHAFKCCGKNNIEETTDYFDEQTLSPEELDLLLDVYDAYGIYTGSVLRNMSHEPDAPWDKVFVQGCNNIISQEAMKTYFQKHPLKEFKINTNMISPVSILPSEWDSEEDSIYDV